MRLTRLLDSHRYHASTYDAPGTSGRRAIGRRPAQPACGGGNDSGKASSGATRSSLVVKGGDADGPTARAHANPPTQKNIPGRRRRFTYVGTMAIPAFRSSRDYNAA